jgi:hypothetical protein
MPYTHMHSATGANGRAMPAEDATTWTAYDAPESAVLLTRDELAAELRALGLDADGDTVRYWEALGTLPRSIKRWHEGATRAIYPDWFVPLVLGLRELQDTASIARVLHEVKTTTELEARLAELEARAGVGATRWRA